MSRYPEIRAGQRITGNLLTSMQYEEIIKSAATIRATDATLTADPDLQFDLEANATYHVEFFVQYATVAAAQFKTDWAVPTGTTGLKRALGAYEDTNTASGGAALLAAAIGGIRLGVHSFSTTMTWGYRASSAQLQIQETGVVVTGSTAGPLQFRWAQSTSNAGNTEVSSGSYARLKRVA